MAQDNEEWSCLIRNTKGFQKAYFLHKELWHFKIESYNTLGEAKHCENITLCKGSQSMNTFVTMSAIRSVVTQSLTSDEIEPFQIVSDTMTGVLLTFSHWLKGAFF